MRPESKSSQRLLRGREREREAIELRKRGLSFATIGAQLGISEGGAHRAVTRVLRREVEMTRRGAEELRALELARLDAMLEGLWPNATSGDPAAVTATLKIMDRRAKLAGLDVEPQAERDAGHSQMLNGLEAHEDPRRQLQRMLGLIPEGYDESASGASSEIMLARTRRPDRAGRVVRGDGWATAANEDSEYDDPEDEGLGS